MTNSDDLQTLKDFFDPGGNIKRANQNLHFFRFSLPRESFCELHITYQAYVHIM
jgi:hypothetical protein